MLPLLEALMPVLVLVLVLALLLVPESAAARGKDSCHRYEGALAIKLTES